MVNFGQTMVLTKTDLSSPKFTRMQCKPMGGNFCDSCRVCAQAKPAKEAIPIAWHQRRTNSPWEKGLAAAKARRTKGQGSQVKRPWHQQSLGKGKPVKKNKLKLKASNLAKLGKMSLAQKVNKASEEAETPEEAAHALNSMPSKQENTRV